MVMVGAVAANLIVALIGAWIAKFIADEYAAIRY
jgi:hypothetical protein